MSEKDKPDFLDFGAGRGKSMIMASETWGGKGIGYEWDKRRCAEACAAGLDCRNVPIKEAVALWPDRSVRYVVLCHVLEHMPDVRTARELIVSAARIASEFVFIAGPWFDSDADLMRRGVKLFASDWPDTHTAKVGMLEIRQAFAAAGCVDTLTIFGRGKIDTTDHDYIYSLRESVSGLKHPYRWTAGQNMPKPPPVSLDDCYYEICAIAETGVAQGAVGQFRKHNQAARMQYYESQQTMITRMLP